MQNRTRKGTTQVALYEHIIKYNQDLTQGIIDILKSRAQRSSCLVCAWCAPLVPVLDVVAGVPFRCCCGMGLTRTQPDHPTAAHGRARREPMLGRASGQPSPPFSPPLLVPPWRWARRALPHARLLRSPRGGEKGKQTKMQGFVRQIRGVVQRRNENVCKKLSHLVIPPPHYLVLPEASSGLRQVQGVWALSPAA